MKKYFLIACLLLITASTCMAQSVYENVNFKLMLFNQFMPSTVFMKNGKVALADLNFNTDKHQLIFIEDKQYKELSGLETIDSIVIDVKQTIKVPNRNKQYKELANLSTVDSIYSVPVTFVPIKDKIYQRTGLSNLYILYSYGVKTAESTTDHSGSRVEDSRVVSNTVTGAYSFMNYKNMGTINTIKDFYILDKSDLIEVRQVKQLAKYYKLDKEAINNYIRDNHVEIHDEQDVLKMIYFFNNPKRR